jgi:enoyl-CoA hydratase
MGALMSKFLKVEFRKNISVLTLNRPEHLNALSFALLEEMEKCLNDILGANPRALIIKGAGDKAFCAGADVGELVGRTASQHRRGVEAGQKLLELLCHYSVPTIALVNGFALGGGLEVALGCDFRLATPTARFGLPEIKLGLIPGYGGTQRLPRLIGEGRALEMIVSGRLVHADEAERIGLIHKIVSKENLMEETLDFISTFENYSLATVAYARRAVRAALDQPIHEGLKVEADCSTLAYQTEDAQEGMKAFLEKRSPAFSDQ